MSDWLYTQIKNMSMKRKQAVLSIKDKQIIISHLDKRGSAMFQKMLLMDGIREWYWPYAVNAAKMNDGLCNAIKLQVFEANKHAWTF